MSAWKIIQKGKSNLPSLEKKEDQPLITSFQKVKDMHCLNFKDTKINTINRNKRI